MDPAYLRLKFDAARRALLRDDHDGALVVVLWDTYEQAGVALDVRNSEEEAEALADEYMRFLHEHDSLEIRVVVVSFDGDDESDEEGGEG